MKMTEYLRREQEEQRQNEIARLDDQANEIKNFLDNAGIGGATVRGDIVEADGLTLRYYSSTSYSLNKWQLQGDCPHCGEQVWSHPVWFDRMGDILDEFLPEAAHLEGCPALRKEPGAEEKLLIALRDFILTTFEE